MATLCFCSNILSRYADFLLANGRVGTQLAFQSYAHWWLSPLSLGAQRRPCRFSRSDRVHNDYDCEHTVVPTYPRRAAAHSMIITGTVGYYMNQQLPQWQANLRAEAQRYAQLRAASTLVLPQTLTARRALPLASRQRKLLAAA